MGGLYERNWTSIIHGKTHLKEKEQMLPTLLKVKELGYSTVQVYGNLELSEKMGLAALKAGLKVIGTTGNYKEFFENPEKTMEVHRRLGATNIGTGGTSFANAEELYKFIEDANNFAKFVTKEGFTFSYHNHSHEFEKIDGKVVYEELTRLTDKENINFVFDTYWAQNAGADVRYWIERLKNRIEILHLKDMKRIDGKSVFAEIGEGNLWWDGIIETAKQSGVTHFVVEQDECDCDPIESIEISSKYLHNKFFK